MVPNEHQYDHVALDEHPNDPNVDGVRYVPNVGDGQCVPNEPSDDNRDGDVDSVQLHN